MQAYLAGRIRRSADDTRMTVLKSSYLTTQRFYSKKKLFEETLKIDLSQFMRFF